MLADLMFRKNEYDSAVYHFQQLLNTKAGQFPFLLVSYYLVMFTQIPVVILASYFSIFNQSGALLISVINNVTDFSYFSFKMLLRSPII